MTRQDKRIEEIWIGEILWLQGLGTSLSSAGDGQ
jgi:hypothetical protein